MKYRLFWLLILTSLLSSKTFATGMPVFDASSFAQLLVLANKARDQVIQLKAQIKSLNDLTKLHTQQNDFLKANLQGNYGYGSLFNDATHLQHRQWSNDNWTDVLNASTGRNSAFMQAQEKYNQMYPVRKASEILPTRSQNNITRTHYEQSRQISRSALATSSYSYDQINDHIKNLHDMLEKLDSQTSEKAAIDLNARLVAELGFIQLELLRQQNIQTQLIATQTQGEVNGTSEEAQFMQWRH
jgi:type IV secretion system protein VirB5